jgi:branched-chain amino acid transport system ATP-binding protein
VGLLGKAEQPAASLSYGDKRMLEITMALALKPKLLMIDEPTEGLAVMVIKDIFDILSSIQTAGHGAIRLGDLSPQARQTP